jgi:hypothetical protein
LDQQHDDVVLMVENFCSRASPTCSRERGKWRAAISRWLGLEEREAVLQPFLI